VRGRLAYQRGSFAVAEDYARRALALVGGEDSSSVFDAAPQVMYALLLADMDRFSEARALVEFCRRGSERLGASLGLHSALVCEGGLALDVGDLVGATQALDAGLAVLE